MIRAALAALTPVVFAFAFAAAALAATHTVDQVNLTFVPDDITIEVGDTVEWIWSAGGHTVTNGVHPDSAGTGDLFDEPLNSLNPVVSFTFTEAGDVPYFCTPHFLFDMTGIVRVRPPTPVEASVTVSSFAGIKNLYR